MADSSWNREESTGTPASPKSMSRDPRPPLDIIAYRYREEESFQSVLSIGLCHSGIIGDLVIIEYLELL